MRSVKALAKDLKAFCKDDVLDILIDDETAYVLIKNNSKSQFEETAKAVKRAGIKHINCIGVEDLLANNLYLKLVHSSYSIKGNQYVMKSLSAESLYLVTYDLTNLNHSQKTMFGYALKGRAGEKGILAGLKGKPVGRNNVLVPSSQINPLKDFFATWKVKYNIQKFLKTENE